MTTPLPESAVATYSFLPPQEIHFGWGLRSELGVIARRLGRRAFVIGGSRTLQRTGVLRKLSQQLAEGGCTVVPVAIQIREPLVADVDALVARLREDRAGPGDVLVAIGGGSAIDLAKAAGALVTNSGSDTVRDYLEGVGRGLKIERPPLPLIAMPTTGGTGTEATKNAVISNLDPPFKKSLRSDLMIPRVVLVDPELSVSVPPQITAWTGMDAITQLIESYICRNSRPIPRALAWQGLELALPALPEAVRNGESRPAREAMSHAALLSGICLANSGLGFAHGVAAALGVHCQVAHGLACAVMLPIALRVNREVSQVALAKLGTLVGGSLASPNDSANRFIQHIDQMIESLGIPRRLSDIGVRADQLDALVPASRGNSMNGNPRDVSDAELEEILKKAL